jgi:predicted transcriptional regulator
MRPSLRRVGSTNIRKPAAPRIQSLKSLRKELKVVARGDREAPPGAARMSFNSTEALLRLLTPGNRALLALIRDRRPDSVVALAKLSGRAQPNLTRTIAKLEAAGLVAIVAAGGKRRLRAIVWKLRVEIDPYSNSDTVEFA